MQGHSGVGCVHSWHVPIASYDHIWVYCMAIRYGHTTIYGYTVDGGAGDIFAMTLMPLL